MQDKVDEALLYTHTHKYVCVCKISVMFFVLRMSSCWKSEDETIFKIKKEFKHHFVQLFYFTDEKTSLKLILWASI